MAEAQARGAAQSIPMTDENFADLLEQSLNETNNRLVGRVVTGNILAIENDFVLVDVGLKSEGSVPVREFRDANGDINVKAGDKIEVFVERFEDKDGVVLLSRDKARREEAWTVLEKAFSAQERVTGFIFGRVKGGFTVDLAGAVAFLPGSQVDIRPVRDATSLMNSPQPFQILKMDRGRGNIVVSRRAVLEETRAEERSELISNLKEGQVLEGVVKNITDYGAFVDLGGVDGLLHVTDIAWRRINHPSEALQIGQTVKVQVIRFNPENQRISLGMKQLESDPWEGVGAKYPVGLKLNGRVTNITDYGAFVELEEGIEGLVHVSEMDWTNKNVAPNKIVSLGDEVEVMVLEIDEDKRRISLGMKQCRANPWQEFAQNTKRGDRVKGPIKSITDFGVFVGLAAGIDGLVHLSDLSWNETGEAAVRNYKKGQEVEAVVLAVDVERERISLGIKQLDADPFTTFVSINDKGAVVTGKVKTVDAKGAEIELGEDIVGYLRASEISADRVDDARNVLKEGDEVTAVVTNVDRKTRNIQLSVRAKDAADQQEAMASLSQQSSRENAGTTSLGALLRAKLDNNP